MSNSDTCDKGLVLWPGGSLLPRPGKHSGWRRGRGTLALGSSFWFLLLPPGVQLFIYCKKWKLIFGPWDGTAVPYILAWNTHGPISVNIHHCTPASLYLGFSSLDLVNRVTSVLQMWSQTKLWECAGSRGGHFSTHMHCGPVRLEMRKKANSLNPIQGRWLILASPALGFQLVVQKWRLQLQLEGSRERKKAVSTSPNYITLPSPLTPHDQILVTGSGGGGMPLYPIWWDVQPEK